jgi:hypothetical protein
LTLVSLSPPHCYNQSHAEKRREGETGDFGVALSSTLLQSEPCREEERGRETGDFGVALSSTVLALRSCVDAPPRAHRTCQCEG